MKTWKFVAACTAPCLPALALAAYTVSALTEMQLSPQLNSLLVAWMAIGTIGGLGLLFTAIVLRRLNAVRDDDAQLADAITAMRKLVDELVQQHRPTWNGPTFGPRGPLPPTPGMYGKSRPPAGSRDWEERPIEQLASYDGPEDTGPLGLVGSAS